MITFLMNMLEKLEEKIALIDIVSEGGKYIFGKKELTGSMFKRSSEFSSFDMDFSLIKTTNLEFRLLRLANIDMKCAGMVLIQTNPDWALNDKRNKQKKTFTINVKKISEVSEE